MGEIEIETIKDEGYYKELRVKTPTCYSGKWFIINIGLLGGRFWVDVMPEGDVKKGRSVEFPKE